MWGQTCMFGVDENVVTTCRQESARTWRRPSMQAAIPSSGFSDEGPQTWKQSTRHNLSAKEEVDVIQVQE